MPSSEQVLLLLLTDFWHRIAIAKHDVVRMQLPDVRWGPTPRLALNLPFLQNKDGSQGKGMNSNEWCWVLENIIINARKAWVEAYPDTPFSQCIFMYDNPSIHNLDVGQKAQLLRPGLLLDSLDQLQQPPKYSGDMMQCIEHIHSWICSEWWRVRFREGEPLSNEDREAGLSNIFYEQVSPDSVRKNVQKLVRLLEHIVEQGTGGYGPPDLV